MHPHFALILTGWISLGMVFGALIGALLTGNALFGIALGLIIGPSTCAVWLAYKITSR